ncbi:RNA methyltransferase [Eubacterium sp. MSJ-13]|uniref:TrmH family RNA methyltransferase n=1 Tax=Eubacterium sp. MSJ-13 TaxID=2841513 RepID=UPI001C109600|nr:RNA methyltransferase [Eubacterium sp. MSJ-13]MBU5479563.1 RNA methyltransferase [Eubacterium sp. MSJ-13]
MNIIEIKDFDAEELDIYARLSEGQLLNRAEPEKGIFIAESPKVIERALDAGYEPISCLIEKKHIDGEGKAVLEKCDRIYQNRKIYSDAEKQENLVLKNSKENTVSEEKYALKNIKYKETDMSDFPVYTAEFDILTKLTGFKLTRGMLCAMHRRSLPALEEICKDAKRIAVLENVMNPTNVGAIFRSAAALNMDAVILTNGSSNPLYRRAARVSMGTVFQIPWTFADISDSDSGETYIERLHGLGFKTAAMALDDNSVSIDDERVRAEEKLAIILGTEGDGLLKSTIYESDYTVKIPMSHGVDSLNVAAASAVVFWELGGKK